MTAHAVDGTSFGLGPLSGFPDAAATTALGKAELRSRDQQGCGWGEVDDPGTGDDGAAAAAAAGIAGCDPGLLAVVRTAVRLAPTSVSVLVSGESGTGKELLARLIHDRGATPHGPFVAVNCGTLPRELADSELFGHERGSFTGAHGRKRGWFEEADGGTLVLDEVGELPLELQPKLLRVLETGRVRRVGGNGDVTVKVRVVALTLRDLRREVGRGAFRLDLYHRLAGFELALPPLRARRGDLARLARHLLDELGRELGPRTIDGAALARLAGHDWPGNVRELRNVLRRAALGQPRHIGADALDLPRAAPLALLDRTAAPGTATGTGCGPRVSALADEGAPDDDAPPPDPAPPLAARWPDGVLDIRGLTFEEIERYVYRWALRHHGGSRRKAARALGVARSTFCDKVKRYGLGRAAPATAGDP